MKFFESLLYCLVILQVRAIKFGWFNEKKFRIQMNAERERALQFSIFFRWFDVNHNSLHYQVRVPFHDNPWIQNSHNIVLTEALLSPFRLILRCVSHCEDSLLGRLQAAVCGHLFNTVPLLILFLFSPPPHDLSLVPSCRSRRLHFLLLTQKLWHIK